MGRRLWILAAVASAVGVASLFEVRQINALGVALVAGPYAAAVGLTAWAGRRHTGAAAVGLAEVVAMTGLSWWEATHRQTEGFEWEFNNDLQFACCCGSNWVVLSVVSVVALLLAQPPPAAGGSPPGGASDAEPGAAADGGA